jgi:hypothetical protein
MQAKKGAPESQQVADQCIQQQWPAPHERRAHTHSVPKRALTPGTLRYLNALSHSGRLYRYTPLRPIPVLHCPNAMYGETDVW